MERPSISTGKGDNGSAATVTGERVSKASSRMHALGDLDELNTVLGLVLSEKGISLPLSTAIKGVQKTLFAVGSDIAVPRKGGSLLLHISASVVEGIEHWEREMEGALAPLKRFILPGGTREAALLHNARAVCRRAERWVVALSLEEEVNPHVKIYLNRLSDALFLAARLANKEAGEEETVV